jgi:uncharacterized radical SAM superfamily protein
LVRREKQSKYKQTKDKNGNLYTLNDNNSNIRNHKMLLGIERRKIDINCYRVKLLSNKMENTMVIIKYVGGKHFCSKYNKHNATVIIFLLNTNIRAEEK